MNKKFNILLYIFILLAVLVMFAGTSYAYYLQFYKVDETNVTIKSINLLTQYDNGNKLNLKKLEFDKEYEYNFSVINDTKDEIGDYKLVFEIITPLDKMIRDNFVYSLESSSKSNDNTNKLVSKSTTIVPVSNQELGVGKITPNNIHSYKLKLKINKNDLDKNYLKDRIFVAKINVVSNN